MKRNKIRRYTRDELILPTMRELSFTTTFCRDLIPPCRDLSLQIISQSYKGSHAPVANNASVRVKFLGRVTGPVLYVKSE